MSHRWLGHDNADGCLSCGVHVDYPWPAEVPWNMPMNSWNAGRFLPWCPGTDVERPHHFHDNGAVGDERGLHCHFCGVTTLDETFSWECAES